nr:MAG TPA: hypothetical protein [Caudoviricetes sp.]
MINRGRRFAQSFNYGCTIRSVVLRWQKFCQLN